MDTIRFVEFAPTQRIYNKSGYCDNEVNIPLCISWNQRQMPLRVVFVQDWRPNKMDATRLQDM